jgi:CxxC motif-containing protein (DUF1111 family)
MGSRESAVAAGVRKGWTLGLVLSLVVGGGVISAMAGAKESSKSGAGKGLVAEGRELFLREWVPNDARAHGGDGLGPVFNESSCVACHNAGGPGGGGPNSKNVDIITAIGNRMPAQAAPAPASLSGRAQACPTQPVVVNPLAEVHAGFRASRSVVLHRFGTDPNYEEWRQKFLAGNVAVQGQVLSVQNVPDLPQGTVAEVVVEKAAPAPAPAETPPLPAPDRSPFDTDATPPAPPAPAPAPQVEPALAPPAVAPATPAPAPAVAVIEPPQPPAVFAAMAMPAQFNPGAGAVDRAAMAIQQARATVRAVAGPIGTQVPASGASLVRSQRNPTALFGAGRIEAIPEAALLAAAQKKYPAFPEVQGRVSRLKDGRIGRFGWKAQTASLRDFTLTACAVELGLEVEGQPQAIIPQAPRYKAAGKDMTDRECDALIAFVGSLPAPAARVPVGATESEAIKAGREVFARIGCAACHSPRLGEVEGIYSDLLLHDMGQDLADAGAYSPGDDFGDGDPEPLTPPVAADGRPAPKAAAAKAIVGARRQEWRTPPLWGVRDSGPYLHDGRAETIEQAVALHGGQGEPSAQRYFKLSPKERQQLQTFLKSLVAPTQGVQ